MTMLAITVNEGSRVAQARRDIVALAGRLGFDETEQGRVALVATELATNLLKHGEGGELLAEASSQGIDVLCLDKGPGMADVAKCVADGYSTGGTPGNGLGAVKRLADAVRIASWPGRGAAVLARLKGGSSRAAAPDDADIAAVVVPMPGEEACGDAWSTHRDAGGRTVLVVDGLGHGPEAAAAATEAVLHFQRNKHLPPAQIVEALHLAMRATRGGAVAVARIDSASGSVAFAGLGNIAAQVINLQGQVRRMVSHNGTAGHNARKVQTFDYPCSDGLLVMHSDGLQSRWSLDAYAGVMRLDPRLVAGLLYRDNSRHRDDSAVVVAQIGLAA